MVLIVNNFLSRWANLRHAADIKKAKLDKALRLQQFHADIHETKVCVWFGLYFKLKYFSKNLQWRASILMVSCHMVLSIHQLIVKVWRVWLLFALVEVWCHLNNKTFGMSSTNQSSLARSTAMVLWYQKNNQNKHAIFSAIQKETVNSAWLAFFFFFFFAPETCFSLGWLAHCIFLSFFF